MGDKSLNKSEIIAQVAERNDISKAQAERVLASLQDIIMNAVAEGTEVKLPGFAAFDPVTRAARTMRNPATGEMIDVPEKKTVRIRPLKKFKDTVEQV